MKLGLASKKLQVKMLQESTYFHKLHFVRLIACQLLHVVENSQETVTEVVDEHNAVSMLQKDQYCVAGCRST